MCGRGKWGRVACGADPAGALGANMCHSLRSGQAELKAAGGGRTRCLASTNGLVQCLLTALVVRPQVRRINCCIPWGGAALLAGQPQLGQPQAKDDVNLLPAAFRSVVVLMLRAVALAPPATTDCACVYLWVCVVVVVVRTMPQLACKS